jgi:hypothetical protein
MCLLAPARLAMLVEDVSEPGERFISPASTVSPLSQMPTASMLTIYAGHAW